MATRTFIARQGLRDLFLVEVCHPPGELGRFYEGAVYTKAADGQLRESSEKPTFSLDERQAADAWLIKGSDPDG